MPATVTDRLNGLTTSVAVKPPCVAVATANITLSGLQTVSSEVLQAGDRVLVIGQTNQTLNGIWCADSGDWVRARDFDGNRDAVQGTLVLVRNDFVDGAIYELTSANPVNFGSSNIIFALRYGANVRIDQTMAEINALVVPVDTSWPEGWVPRYGALGDGTVETVQVQRALTVGMQGVPVHFPPNKTYVVGQMNIKAGMRIEGHGPTSVLKLAPNSIKFTRMLTTDNNLWDQPYDSPLIDIDGLTFDGNRLNQGAYVGFEKEQQSPIFLSGHNAQAGRLRTRVSNCFFRDTCGDGIHPYWNTDTLVENCWFDDCFRSSIALTGGYSKLRVSDCRGVGATHVSLFQVEIDGAGFGGSKRCELLMTNSDWLSGLDIALDGGSTIYMANVIFRGADSWYLNGDGNSTGLKTISNFVNCSFRIGSTSNVNRLLRYGICRFEGCTFEWTNNTYHDNLIQQGLMTNGSLTFEGCSFKGDATYHTATPVAISTMTWAAGLLTVNTAAAHGLVVNNFVEIADVTTDVNGIFRVEAAADADTFTVPFPRTPGAVTVGSGTSRLRSNLQVLGTTADTLTNYNQINVFNCTFDESVDCAFNLRQGGNLCMRGNHVRGGILYFAGSGATFMFDVRIGQYTFGPKHRQMCHVMGATAGCTLRHEDTYIPVERSGFTRSSNLTGLTMLGSRLIYGAGAALSTDPGFLGDRYRRATPTAANAQQYCCTVPNPSGAATTWAVETTLA